MIFGLFGCWLFWDRVERLLDIVSSLLSTVTSGSTGFYIA